MELYSKTIKEVESLPEGPQIGAFFDFDGTIIHGYSATTYLREQVKRGDIKPRQLVELVKVMAQFGLGSLDFSVMLTMASQFLGGIKESEYLEFSEQLYKKHIAKLIYPESRALVEAHLKKGHTVALISAATPYQIQPAAKELGIPNVKCSRLEVVDGKFTGGIIRPTVYGMGKVDAAEQLVEQYDLDISQSFFYTDSDEDLQLLEYVGKPRPINPNKRLRQVARGRGWPVQDFYSRGHTKPTDYLKTAATQLSMVTSFAAGIPIYALTGSLNKTRNFSMSLFADTACALTGLELDIDGEENAWKARPCVFVFNHQSQADVLILPTLLRRDLAGVGKKEIGNVPILGKLMQFGGTVLIDRDNTASAKEAMKPLVDVMLKEGRSVCIAPEGTRSTSTNLGRFKKGAFHLAMQAGVPIVPIVIHNAIDVAPRGQYVFKPATVKVTVLPPVETTSWTAASMDEHVHDVRDMFLEELDQMRFQPSRSERIRSERAALRLEAQKRAKRRKAAKAKLDDKSKTATEKSLLKQVGGTAASLSGKLIDNLERSSQVDSKKEIKRSKTKVPKKSARATDSDEPINRKAKRTTRGKKIVLEDRTKSTTRPSRRKRKPQPPKVSAKALSKE